MPVNLGWRTGWKIVGLLRLGPELPFNLQNYFSGITDLRARSKIRE